MDDPAQMSIDEIEAELAELKLHEGRSWEREARRWRLRFELRYRQMEKDLAIAEYVHD